jgi:D-amino-acid oxidase
MAQEKKHILILGAGITALQTALSLLSIPTSPYTITLLASHTPGDLSPSYTSPWAGGHWRSHATLSPSDALLREWDARTYAAWKNLLAEGGEDVVKRVGLGVKESRNFWG